jgi:hypothetical protein
VIFGFIRILISYLTGLAQMSAQDDASIFGNTTRDLWQLFHKNAGDKGVLSFPQIRPTLNSINLYPSKSQIFELVHCACESSGRTPVDHITFGEFCILITELQEHYRKCPSAPQPRSQLKDKLLLEERRRRRRLSGHAANFKVFLGGSCNPTTWRHDTAIPFLKENGITFYNPQVSDWKPELMEIEDQAKQTAELLFFVIDNKTRSTASMVEAAYLAGCGRQLILVIKSFLHPGTLIAGEPMSVVEYEDLERSHAYLTDLVERQGIPVFTDIHVALSCTGKAVAQNLKVGDLTLEDGAQPVKYPHVRVADKFMKLKDVFYSVDIANSGRLSYKDVCLAYRTITDEVLPLPPPIPGTKEPSYTFDQFCCLIAEYRYKRKSFWRRILGGLYRLPFRLLDWVRGQPSQSGKVYDNDPRQRDVFLGGTCGKSTWREDIAIPILRKHGISYFNPQLPEWTPHYIPLEAAVKDSCRLLLYTITADTRGITSMLEAGHYIGQGCDVVLCIQNLQDGVVIDGEELTPTGVKDYNRARSYLADLANRDGVPIFSDVEEAIDCVVQRIKDN